ncbi:AAA family ATPase [Evansella cellulosilytica]|uniref:Nuclease SbcCD subunit C n=1 Tax=Evansella cellulosilytica (strain ATCC 21833 / DSM 2522 / FERM P-1141 / JCM 9156 / N-4) TaxID=649639 RepID=E6U0B3_EVAC2|nr:SbcC/MukB-like Walker B domain-containing protein [Evansella cellulosilytica]ADU30229.1 SMC domain protein [Evansella cellulosilytica DSM 2522]
MKPLTLSLKGLHSFREKQTVDFRTLCEGGIFGIFGPTGSGKSSLLDAMTLALYGKVERAANNTQGILNHAEDTLFVSFSFQLGHGKRTKSYEVERTFKRSGDITVRSSTCRFIDTTSERVVLADKTGDVNRQIEDLLGLSIDDFTRAVVLPQGKFSEFLSLKGQDRRQMLQRLFHLEKYGDDLQRKLKSRLMDSKHERELIEKEQIGLGNASQEALMELETELKVNVDKIKETKEKLVILEQQEEKEKKIIHLQQEIMQTEYRLKELNEKEQEMKHDESKVKKASEANILSPYLKELQISSEEVDLLEKKLKQQEKELTVLTEKATAAEQHYLISRRNKEENEAPIRLKLEELERIKKEQEELQIEATKLNEMKSNLQKIADERDKLEVEKNQVQDDKKKYEQKQQELKGELKHLEVSNETKRHIYNAVQQKQTIDQLSERVKEIEEEFDSLKEKQIGSKNDLLKVKSALKEKESQVSNDFQKLYKWYERISEEERELHAAMRRLTTYKKEIEHENLHVIANKLKKELKDGIPCIVCGSVNHQGSFKIDNEVNGDNEIDDQEAKLLNMIDELETEKRELERVKWEIDSFSTSLKHIVTSEEVATTEENDVEHMKVISHNHDKNFHDYINVWEKNKLILPKERLAIRHLVKKMEGDLKEHQRIHEQYKDMLSKLNVIEERKNEVEKKVINIVKKYNDEVQNWTKAFSPYDLKNVDVEFQEVQQKEERAALYRERIEKSVPFIQGKQSELENLTQQLNDQLVIHSSLKAELNEKQLFVSNKKQRIVDIIGHNDVHQMINEWKESLNNLYNTFNDAEKDWKESEGSLRKLRESVSIIKESLRHAQERFNRSKQVWQDQILLTSFQTIEEVKNAKLSKDEMNILLAKIEKFNNEMNNLTIKLEHYKKELGDHSIRVADYESTVASRKKCKNELDMLYSKQGGIEASFRDIKQRVARYEELEEKKKSIETQYTQLIKLEHVFRGKAFVEYIAEEQLVQVSRLATEKLYELTRGRYAIEVDSNGGFIIRDDANGGVKRPVSTLSGGETFLTSLALALSLSTSIQLKGEHPLEFFFLDEGFGTLDQELLETVISALERLQTDQLSVGVISHVPELRERLPRKLIVTPSEASGRGSSVTIEML